MPNQVLVSDVRFAAASPELRAKGVRGWASCLFDGWLQVDGLAVRRAADGRVLVSFPVRTDADGKKHAYFLPIAPETQAEIAAQVIAEVRRRGYVP